MSTLTNSIGHAIITPNFTNEDRVEYVQRQLEVLRDMLDGAEDCKWIYNALMEYTLALSVMESRDLRADETAACSDWLAELRKLDPFRRGRWDDIEKSLKV